MFGYCLSRAASLTKCITNGGAALLCRTNAVNRTQTCGYARKGVVKTKGKGAVKEEQKGPEVCTDPVRLTSHAVGVNIFKQGDDPKLKPHEEYPEWLFQLNLGNAQKLSELESDTWQYWRRLRKENIWRTNKLQKWKKI
ncbi:39S ribosomal protein L54, mitochondrial-like [Stegastes partitus]|uniref:Large ribosomal subunit protein mL54 n=1 Tax=Stegastes partitus TaxID=144197 RepID=A0A3B5AIM2_9TELE|nr:PREDICTED: 39S ribosomal protein L54, mitochondrial-like [Stegastes partitus]XP_008295687.1 PREDICTED: 39S ribosomal protein L54, mitochondrial-like [Stegastes partitus]